MARRKQHPKLAAITGAIKRNPERYPEIVEERSEGIGDPPKYLGKVQKQIWHELKANAVVGLLTISDREAFAYLCRMVSIARREKVNASMARELRMYFGIFGMTPAERARIPGGETGARPKPKGSSGPAKFGKVS